MARTLPLATRKDYEALPEGAPYELHDGILVKQAAPRYGHQRCLRSIQRALVEHVGWERVATSPVDCLIDEINVFQPDLVVFGEKPEDLPEDDDQYIRTPRIVVEALSLSTAGRDRGYKARRYLGIGVKEVWLLDWHRQTIEVIDFNGSRIHEADDPARSDALPGFRITPVALYTG